jgi:hypothetical protein
MLFTSVRRLSMCILCELSGIPEQLSRSQKVLSGSEESRQKVRAECKKVSFGIRSWLAAEPLNRIMFIFINFSARLAIFSVNYFRHSTERSCAQDRSVNVVIGR